MADVETATYIEVSEDFSFNIDLRIMVVETDLKIVLNVSVSLNERINDGAKINIEYDKILEHTVQTTYRNPIIL